jgi:hypothetical protein
MFHEYLKNKIFKIFKIFKTFKIFEIFFLHYSIISFLINSSKYLDEILTMFVLFINFIAYYYFVSLSEIKFHFNKKYFHI